MKPIKFVVFSAIILLFITGCAGKKNEAQYKNIKGSVWHTTFSITYKSDMDLNSDIFDAMNRVEKSLSPFLSSSQISAINNNKSDEVDELIEKILLKSQSVNRLSNGAFDPTLAPLINLWGFGYENIEGEPSQSMIDSCLLSVGINDCHVENGHIVKKSPDTQFNFSAITKGFGCDMVAEALYEAGCEDFMIEIGGEVSVSGRNPKGDLWHIQIDTPQESNILSNKGIAIIEVTDCGIATSGNYRNFHETTEGRVGHTISPVTGRPVATNTLSVTVIAPTTMEADAFATACMAIPYEEAFNMIENQTSLSALFILNENGQLICKPTSRFPAVNEMN